MLHRWIPHSSATTIAGFAIVALAIYLLLFGMITVKEFGAMMAPAITLMAMPMHGSTPLVATVAGPAVPVAVITKETDP